MEKVKYQCVILGGGGHCRVLIECLLSSTEIVAHSIVDANRSLWGQELYGVPVRGGDEILGRLRGEGVTHFIVGLGGNGDNAPRMRLFELGLRSGLTAVSLVHAAAICSPRARMGAGTVIFPGAVVNAGASLGNNVIVNTTAVVEHDCVIGDHVHVATGAKLCGGVRVGFQAHIGAGSTVKEGVNVGQGAVVGAGSVILRDVLPWSVVAGVPGRLIRMIKV